ncbi:MAG TPA: voltage-gated chloride channel, partial [Nitrospirae bacterium]|nr:voltage-gated chloride channel [Nitrospirota bacterium]
IVTPIFFIGAASGSLFGDLMGLDRATFAAIGLVGVLAGAANTPVSASIMAIELFGAEIAPYAALVCVISYLITGHRSVYPTQIIVRSKSPSVEVETGKEIEEISLVTIRPRSKTLYSLLIQIFETAKRMVKRAYEHYRKRK